MSGFSMDICFCAATLQLQKFLLRVSSFSLQSKAFLAVVEKK